MSGPSLLAEARRCGITLAIVSGEVRLSAAAPPDPALLARLRMAKAELAELLQGDRCRRCGQRMAWPGPAGLMFADGAAECHPCTDAEGLRQHASVLPVVESPAKPVEIMLQGGLLP
jgi:hypothetical protein